MPAEVLGEAQAVTVDGEAGAEAGAGTGAGAGAAGATAGAEAAVQTGTMRKPTGNKTQRTKHPNIKNMVLVTASQGFSKVFILEELKALV